MSIEIKRDKLSLSVEEACELISDDLDGFKVVSDEIEDTHRWSISHRVVVQRLSDGKYFSDYYSVGATESQDESPFEYEPPNFIEVFPVEKTVIVFE
jgi:hypothetical protein